MIEQFVNKRHSLKNLTDEQFDAVIDQLALELEGMEYRTQYTQEELWKDWNSLCQWEADTSTINSTSRVGLKLCEQFFPNFYEIENAKGQSFSKLWTAPNLKKILRWNRKSHSTPYLSELKRGIYFCCGLTKNTMYRPQMMKLACAKFSPNVVFDPCAGWGGRLLGAVGYGAHYVAFEPNTKTFEGLQRLVEFLGIHHKVTLICDDALNMHRYDFPHADMVLTSPPYFDVEVYTHEDTQSIRGCTNYEEWSQKFLRELIKKSLDKLGQNSVSCWNVGKVATHDMNCDVLKYHEEFGYQRREVLSLISSKRQANQSELSTLKNNDDTVVFERSDVPYQKRAVGIERFLNE